MENQHQHLASGRWFEMTLCEQLGNIGSEIGRAAKWQNKNQKIYEAAFFRAHELMMLTLCDQRWSGRRKELARAKEVMCDAYTGGELYKSDFAGLEKYFFHFAFAARNKKVEA